MTLPITGTLGYLAGESPLMKLHVSIDTGRQQITSDSWVTSTPTVINEWEIVSTDPTICQNEVLSSRHSYPQCTAWKVTPSNTWSLECTVGHKGTLDILAVVNNQNQVTQLQENTTIAGMTDSFTFIITSQGTTPPPVSDFALPSICNAPNGNNQGENDNSQGNEEGQCTDTIPSICL